MKIMLVVLMQIFYAWLFVCLIGIALLSRPESQNNLDLFITKFYVNNALVFLLLMTCSFLLGKISNISLFHCALSTFIFPFFTFLFFLWGQIEEVAKNDSALTLLGLSLVLTPILFSSIFFMVALVGRKYRKKMV